MGWVGHGLIWTGHSLGRPWAVFARERAWSFMVWIGQGIARLLAAREAIVPVMTWAGGGRPI
jgi:hypothetical protein